MIHVQCLKIYDIDDNIVLDNSNCNDNNKNEFCTITTNKSESNIKLIWSPKLNATCGEMFIELANIIEVDLSKIGVSLKSMGNLFKNCSSLVKVNLKPNI